MFISFAISFALDTSPPMIPDMFGINSLVDTRPIITKPVSFPMAILCLRSRPNFSVMSLKNDADKSDEMASFRSSGNFWKAIFICSWVGLMVFKASSGLHRDPLLMPTVGSC